MALDNAKNFAKATVSTGYDASATSVVLSAGHGAKLPTPSFNLTWWNFTDYPDPSDDPNVEIVRCTALSTDTLTIVRAQESTAASTKNTATKTYKMLATITAKVLNIDLLPGVATLTVSLSAADIKALARGASETNPFTLLPAPDTGKINVIFGVVLDYKFGTRAYVANGPGLQICYAGGTAQLLANSETPVFLTGAQSRLLLGSLVSNTAVTDASGLVNLARTEARDQAVQLLALASHSFDAGPIVTASISAAGSGYAVNDTGTIDPGLFLASGDATYKVTSISGGGVVTGIEITVAGTVYPVSHGFHYDTDSSGVGTGLTIDVNTVNSGDGTLSVTVYYTVVTLQ